MNRTFCKTALVVITIAIKLRIVIITLVTMATLFVSIGVAVIVVALTVAPLGGVEECSEAEEDEEGGLRRGVGGGWGRQG